MDKGKHGSSRENTVLFIDAHHIYRQIDRAHRDFTPQHIEYIANIVRLYREENIEASDESMALIHKTFPEDCYKNIPGLCQVATLEEIEEQGWSLSPGRYIEVAEHTVEDFDFREKLSALNEELELLNVEAHTLEGIITTNIVKILEDQ